MAQIAFIKKTAFIVSLLMSCDAYGVSIVVTDNKMLEIADIPLSASLEAYDFEKTFFAPIKSLSKRVDITVRIKTSKLVINLSARQSLMTRQGWKSAIDLSLSELVLTKAGWAQVKYVSIEKSAEFVDVTLKDAEGYFMNEFFVKCR